MVDIREISNPNEVENFPRVISSAWGVQNMATELVHVVNATTFHGGLTLGAYDGDEIVGIQFSFPGYRKGVTYLYSHMTGLLEEKKYSGIGYSMKLYQKKWAREHGFKLVAWTFDPARSMNAYFNTHKLGTMSRTVVHNFYGKFEDVLNSGIPSDRLIAEWWVDESRLTSPSSETTTAAKIKEDGSYEHLMNLQETESDAVFLPTIRDISEFMRDRKEKVVRFKNDLCNALEVLFEKNYIVSDFRRTEEETGYILTRDARFQQDHSVNIFSEQK